MARSHAPRVTSTPVPTIARSIPLHPGPDGLFASGGVNGPGQQFSPSNIINDDRVGSQGIVGSIYLGYDHDNNANPVDICTPDQTAPFFHNRRVTGRNTPPMIGAVFNRQNFWDGRANDKFNGNDPFGNTDNQLGQIGPTVTNSSLASQSVGPPNNEVEMSCKGRPFNGENALATKLFPRQPLQSSSSIRRTARWVGCRTGRIQG